MSARPVFVWFSASGQSAGRQARAAVPAPSFLLRPIIDLAVLCRVYQPMLPYQVSYSFPAPPRVIFHSRKPVCAYAVFGLWCAIRTHGVRSGISCQVFRDLWIITCIGRSLCWTGTKLGAFGADLVDMVIIIPGKNAFFAVWTSYFFCLLIFSLSFVIFGGRRKCLCVRLGTHSIRL